MKPLASSAAIQTSVEAKQGDQATRLPYLFWCLGGLLETAALLGGFYWIMNNPDTRWLVWRVIGVAALAISGGGLSLAGAAIASKSESKYNLGD